MIFFTYENHIKRKNIVDSFKLQCFNIDTNLVDEYFSGIKRKPKWKNFPSKRGNDLLQEFSRHPLVEIDTFNSDEAFDKTYTIFRNVLGKQFSEKTFGTRKKYNPSQFYDGWYTIMDRIEIYSQVGDLA